MRLVGQCGDIFDAESVLYGQYKVGGTPTPGGLTLDVLTTNFLAAWSGYWTTFMASSFSSINSCTVRVIDNFVGTGGNKFKIQSTDLWTVNNQTIGQVVDDALPSFAAYNIEKRTFAAGRGRQGHLRLWGVPETFSIGDELDSAQFNTMQASIQGRPDAGTTWLVGAVGKTDFIQLRIVNGKLVNVNPGQPPVFYLQFVEQLLLQQVLSSQITRKFGRHRRV